MKRKRTFVETNERMQLVALFANDICSVNYRNVCRGQFPSTIVLPRLKYSQKAVDYIRKGLKIEFGKRYDV